MSPNFVRTCIGSEINREGMVASNGGQTKDLSEILHNLCMLVFIVISPSFAKTTSDLY